MQSLKVCSIVFEMEVAPKRKPETYTREVQCEIIDPKKLNKIKEDEDEDDSDDFEKRFTALQMNRGGNRSRSGSERRGSVTTGIVETRRADNSQIKRTMDRQYTEADTKEMSKDEAK